ncbi:MAG: DUF6514 family protein [Defluviitaleaceae bacterium]|nr:DUF6514 family protein [Defluviitaleaceae bacterium]
MKTINLVTEAGNTLEVNYKIAQFENFFGITINHGEDQRTEYFTEDKSHAEKILEICSANEVMIASLGDVIDEYIYLKI